MIENKFNILFCDKYDTNKNFYINIVKDKRFEPIYEDNECFIFKVKFASLEIWPNIVDDG